MAKVKHGKNYTRKEPLYSVDADGGGKRIGVRLFYEDGYSKTLLNPYGKALKYSYELTDNRHETNEGIMRTDADGYAIPLSPASRAYRSGYLVARRDNAKAYKAKHR